MTIMSAISVGRVDALLAALKAELGGVLAGRVLESEALDFLWEARISERYLGQFLDDFCGSDEPGDELSRVVVLSLLDGLWHVALCLIDGEGCARELLWRRSFEGSDEAQFEFVRAR
ncbi:MAG TPA: hypothetical protein VMG08_08860 [Allosphingosinicella sp.]|nr:hypothetical protein [Allosphingosinicella sp.]